MASLGRVYIETSVVSYLASRPSRDILVAAHQQITFDWWDRRRPFFDIFISQLVVREASAGDPTAAARRLALVETVPLLALNDPALSFAQKLVDDGSVPVGSEEDALHVALAAVHGVHFLLTWNCKHIANATMRPRIERSCSQAGFSPPIICTPEELLED